MFVNKYRRKRFYNYDSSGRYFVTICTKNRIEHFGSIKDSRVYLSEYGLIAKQCWINILNHFQCARLHQFIIMPNHVHGIIEIEYRAYIRDVDPHENRNNQKLMSIIGSFKSAVTKEINRLDSDLKFGWQRSFYDRIVRDDDEFYKISEYIKNNPYFENINDNS